MPYSRRLIAQRRFSQNPRRSADHLITERHWFNAVNRGRFRMKINNAGLALIKRCEGLRLDAYQDGVGVWTIGYGSTLGVHKGMVITPGEAERKLLDDLSRHDITPYLGGCKTTENQFAAMTSLAFNIGLHHFEGSTVRKRHVLGNYSRAAAAFLLWDEDNGKVIPGLLSRREQERMLYLA